MTMNPIMRTGKGSNRFKLDRYSSIFDLKNAFLYQRTFTSFHMKIQRKGSFLLSMRSSLFWGSLGLNCLGLGMERGQSSCFSFAENVLKINKSSPKREKRSGQSFWS